MNNKTNRMTKIALLVAISTLLMYFDFPIIPAFPFLKIDLSEVPALMGGFAFGPLVGGLIVILKVLLRMLIKGTETGGVGEMANIIIGLSLVIPASLIYNMKKTKKNAIIGMFVGLISIEVIGILANIYIILPAYGWALKGSELTHYVTAGLLPFNGLKAIMVSVITYVLYKRVSVAIFKEDSGFGAKSKNKVTN